MNEWNPGLWTLTEKGNMKINVINENEKKIVKCIQKCLFMQSAICIKRFWSMQSATFYMNSLVFLRIIEWL